MDPLAMYILIGFGLVLGVSIEKASALYRAAKKRRTAESYFSWPAHLLRKKKARRGSWSPAGGSRSPSR